MGGALPLRWRYSKIVGLAATGRTTVAVLAMNHPYQTSVREALVEEGTWPV